MIVSVIHDLIFSSKVRGQADLLSVPVKNVRTIEQLRTVLSSSRPKLIILDLGTPDDLAIQAIALAKELAARIKILCFFSHVDVDLKDRALAAGATEVVPRSIFVEQLPHYIATETGEKGATGSPR